MLILLIAPLAVYAGFAAFCASSRRHVREIWPTPPSAAKVQVVRGIGYGWLTLGLIACIAYWGGAYGLHGTPAMGVVYWACLLSVIALMMVTAFAYLGRPVVLAGGAAGGIAALLGLCWAIGLIGVGG